MGEKRPVGEKRPMGEKPDSGDASGALPQRSGPEGRGLRSVSPSCPLRATRSPGARTG